MSYNLSQVKILLVEDMPPMLSLTTSILTMFGFQIVHGAKNVQEAYKLFCRNNHDLIITDWLMEPEDGLDLVRMVRRNEDTPNPYVPVILMTGYSDQTRVEMARDLGVTEFLMKPYSAHDMYMRIVQIIEKPRQFVDTGQFFGPDRRRRKNVDFYGIDRRDDVNKNIGKEDALENKEEIEVVLRDMKNDLKKI